MIIVVTQDAKKLNNKNNLHKSITLFNFVASKSYEIKNAQLMKRLHVKMR